MVRLAESSWDLWKPILATNGAEIGRSLDLYIRNLRRVRQKMANPDRLGPLFETAACCSKLLRKSALAK